MTSSLARFADPQPASETVKAGRAVVEVAVWVASEDCLANHDRKRFRR
jgi:hypothetical protein